MTDLNKLGIKIGHYTDLNNLTGATVFIPDNGADIGIDVRGSDTGSINIPAYDIKGADKTVEAIVLTGGSTKGLECSIGVMDYLDTPSVVGAVIYDRNIGKDVRPNLKNGFDMARDASYKNLEQGNFGVGTGATTGKWITKNKIKGGFGYQIKEITKDAYVGVFVVTNAIGDVINPATKKFYSECGNYNLDNYYDNDFGNIERGTNTTLAVVVTNIEMTREELIKVSEMTHDGMARSIFPIHTNWDGDVVFAISPHSENRVKLNLNSFDLVNFVGIASSTLINGAIKNSILNAESVDGCLCYKDKFKHNNF